MKWKVLMKKIHQRYLFLIKTGINIFQINGYQQRWWKIIMIWQRQVNIFNYLLIYIVLVIFFIILNYSYYFNYTSSKKFIFTWNCNNPHKKSFSVQVQYSWWPLMISYCLHFPMGLPMVKDLSLSHHLILMQKNIYPINLWVMYFINNMLIFG